MRIALSIPEIQALMEIEERRKQVFASILSSRGQADQADAPWRTVANEQGVTVAIETVETTED